MLFSTLACYFEELEGTTSRKSLIGILARLFGEAQPDEVDKLAYLCQGRLTPFYEPIEIGMGERTLAESIAQAYGTTRNLVLTRYGVLGDLGLVARELAEKKLALAAESPESPIEPTAKPPPEVIDVFSCLYEIATTSGAKSVERRLRLFSELLARIDPISAKHLARIPLGKLRLGIGDPTLLDAFSFAKVGNNTLRKPLERAYNETSDLGLIGRTLWSGGMEAVDAIQIQLGKPIRPALAERLPSAEAIIAKLGRCAVEPKLDGFRCQIHKDGQTIRVFSRNLEDMSAMFPEVVESARTDVLAETAIFEGEAVAYNPESDEYRPFQETSRRRRKHNISEISQELPLRLFVFDVMYLNGENIAPLPYLERRKKLESLFAPSDVLSTTTVTITEEPKVLHTLLLDNVQKGLEGIVAKKLDSVYQAGSRNFNWVKLKRLQSGHLADTVDCVILGFIYGRGKRASFGVGALLVGVYDPERDEFATITKIGTGLSDIEWREIRARCDAITVPERPARVSAVLQPSVWVSPKVVIEVLADEITRSPVHTAGRGEGELGYALRFPRLISFRSDDKRPEDATTVSEIISMYDQQAALRSRAEEASDDLATKSD